LNQEKVQQVVLPTEGWVARYIDVYNEKIEVPPEALAATAFTLLSAVVGWKGRIQFADSYEPLTLYTALVGASAAAHKTTSLNIAERIGQDANDRWKHETGHSLDDVNLLRVVHGGHLSQAGLLDILGPKDEQERERWSKQPPPCTLLVWDELRDLIVDRKQHSFQTDTKHMLLRTYSGYQPGSKTRANPVLASRCSMAMMGTVTLDTWQEQLGPESVAGGMMGRLLAIPYGRPPKYISRPVPVSNAARNELVDWLVSLGKLPQLDWGVVDFDSEAGEHWDQWYHEKKQLIEHTETTDTTRAQAIAALFGRYQTTAIKFATISSISRWEPEDPNPPSLLLGLRDLEVATAYIDQLLDFSVPVASEALEGDELRFCRRVLERLQVQGPMSWSEISRAVRVRGIKSNDAKRLMEIMHAKGELTFAHDEQYGGMMVFPRA